jgi:hypothetical protein
MCAICKNSQFCFIVAQESGNGVSITEDLKPQRALLSRAGDFN